MHFRNILPLALLLTGCSSNSFLPTSTNATSVTGNWQFAATPSTPSFSGELTGAGTTITGILHASAVTSCFASSSPIDLTGVTSSANILTLTGAAAGGTLTVTGTLAADGKSLSNATYQITGGACAFASTPVHAQAFAPITGNYTGTFSDASGPVVAVTATLTQTPASDTSGNFQLSGTATFGTNSCFASPATISSSQVTGGSFTLTYTDPTLNNSVTASGTFTPDGQTLNVTNWSLNGTCGTDSGTGTLTKQ